jgi:hypothetical protein
MINAVSVTTMLADRVAKKDSYRPSGNSQEQRLVDQLYQILDDVATSSSYQVENESTLDYDDWFEDSHDDENDVTEVDEENDPTFDGSDNEEDRGDDALLMTFFLEYMKNVVDFYDAIDETTGKRKQTWKNVQHRFKRVRHLRYLSRFRKYLKDHGTKKQKLDDIDTFVFERFEAARENCLSIHDIDLKRWALQRAQQQSLLEFAASKHWITTFKHRHGIVSRKTTKFVTKHALDDAEEIEQAAARFLKEAKAEMQEYRPTEIMNTDQVGLEKELHSTWTLNYQGEKLTVAAVKSKSAITHSYTLQPMINLAGEVVGPIYLCLKEPDGRISESEFAYIFFPVFSLNSPRRSRKNVSTEKCRHHM